MENKTGRAYSTDYKVHTGLIAKLAARGWGRLQEAGVVIDFDDVFQEMSMIYCKAAAKYNPESGNTFTAYLGRAIWNDFNKFAETLERNETKLGLVRFEDMQEDDTAFMYETVPSSSPTPEDELLSGRVLRDGMSQLNHLEKCVVGTLIRRDFSSTDRKEVSLTKVMISLKMSRRSMDVSRKRIYDAFGVAL